MRFTITALCLSLIVLPGSLGAQEVKKSRMATGFEPASVKNDLQHGRLVELTVKGQGKVKGTLVRSDRDRLYVRTEPGAAPKAIAMNDIEKMDKGVQYAVSKDNIKLTGTESEIINPEINVLEFLNGTKRTVRYSSASLSPGERSMLLNLESAENELARLETQSARENQVIETSLALQKEELRTAELRNQYQQFVNTHMWRQGARTDWWMWNETGFRDLYYGGEFARPLFGQAYGQPNVIQPGPVIMPPVTPVAPEALARARQNVATAQANAVFQGDRLVAVIVPEK